MSASASATLQAIKNAGSAAHRALQTSHPGALVVIGSGRVGAAFASSEAKAPSFRVVGMFDLDQTKVGKVCGGEVVRSMNRLPHHLKAFSCKTAVLAVPQSVAQKAADLCVRSGIKSIINYTPFPLQVPQDVVVENVWQAPPPSEADLLDPIAISQPSPRAALSAPSEHALSQPATPGSVWALDSRFLQDYTVGDTLGKGGGGTVLRVRNRVDGALYALKAVLIRKTPPHPAGPSVGLSEELLAEARTLAAVSSHPNIVRYHQSWVEPLSQALFQALFPSRRGGSKHSGSGAEERVALGSADSPAMGSGALSVAAGLGLVVAAVSSDDDEQGAETAPSAAFSLALPSNPYYPRPLRSVLDITVPPRASPSEAEPSTPLSPVTARAGPPASIPPAFSSLPSLFSLGEMVCSPLSPPDEPDLARRQRASANSLSTLGLSEPHPLRLPRAPVSPLARTPAAPASFQRSATAEALEDSEDDYESGSDDEEGEDEDEEETSAGGFLTAGMVRRGAVPLAQVDVLFIQMELCAPSTLADWLQSPDRTGSADARSRLRMFRGVLRGVRHVHSAGFVHRDLKPGNVFLKDSGAAQIGDFGLSIAHCGPEAGPPPGARPAAGVGTAAYASPEQLAGTCDARLLTKADMYSLGLMLLEVFCAPFSTMMERAQVMQAARAGTLPACLSEAHPQVAALVRALTDRDPLRRPSADEALRLPLFRGLRLGSLGSSECDRLRARVRDQEARIRALEDQLARQQQHAGESEPQS